jgi:hypothetical protein
MTARHTSPGNGDGRPLGALQRFLAPQVRKRPGEMCEMCATDIGDEHSHVVNLENRNLMCTCRPCYLLFTTKGAAGGKFRAVPERFLFDPKFRLSNAQWDELQIPVRVAFFFCNSALDRVVAFYPSPAGATESMLPLGAWQSLVADNPLLTQMEPDVEALLVYGRRDAPFECYIVPIASCYELTGVVKRRWKGFDGGQEAWRDIDAFFAGVREKSHPASDRSTP